MSILELPNEILVNIAREVPLNKDLLSLRLTSRRLSNLINDPILWLKKLIKEHPSNLIPHLTQAIKPEILYKRVIDPDLYVWGESSDYRLGHLPQDFFYTELETPFKHSFRNVKEISCGGWMSSYLDRKGDLYIFGNMNAEGFYPQNQQLRVPTRINLETIKIKSISSGRTHIACLTDENKIIKIDNPDYGHVLFELGVGFVKVASGWNSILGLSEDNRIFLFNTQNATGYYELIYPLKRKEKFVQVAAGDDFSVARTNNGNVIIWNHVEESKEHPLPAHLFHRTMPGFGGIVVLQGSDSEDENSGQSAADNSEQESSISADGIYENRSLASSKQHIITREYRNCSKVNGIYLNNIIETLDEKTKYTHVKAQFRTIVMLTSQNKCIQISKSDHKYSVEFVFSDFSFREFSIGDWHQSYIDASGNLYTRGEHAIGNADTYEAHMPIKNNHLNNDNNHIVYQVSSAGWHSLALVIATE